MIITFSSTLLFLNSISCWAFADWIKSKQLPLCLVAAVKRLTVQRYSVGMFLVHGTTSVLVLGTLSERRVSLKLRLGGWKDAAFALISSETTQSNRVLCSWTLYYGKEGSSEIQRTYSDDPSFTCYLEDYNATEYSSAPTSIIFGSDLFRTGSMHTHCKLAGCQ